MFTHDLFSTVPTKELTAEQAYAAYWAVATSEDHALAGGDGPVYRFARDYMLRAVMAHYGLSISEAAWLYDEVLPEGPGWGSLDRMVAYGREMKFGRLAIARAVLNCRGCVEAVHDYADVEDYVHAIDCPFNGI